MMRLFRVELRRLWWRRATWGIALLAVVVGAFTVAVNAGSARPPTEAQIAEAEVYYAQELEWWEAEGDADVESCLADEAADPDPDADYGCASWEPQLEDYLPMTVEYFPSAEARERMFGTGVEGSDADPEVAAVQQSFWQGWSGLPGTVPVTWFLLLLALVVGVSFVTAEISSGSLGMWLTFEPRRRPVYLAKAAAAALGVLPVVLVGWLATAGGLYAVHAFFGTVGDVSAASWTEVATFTGRLALAGAAVGAVGVALGVLLRHAAAAIGVAAGVVWVTSAFFLGSGEAQRWMPGVNIDAWLRGGATYGYATEGVNAEGVRYEEWVERVVTQTQGGLYLLGLVVVISVGALLVFRRRDVN